MLRQVLQPLLLLLLVLLMLPVLPVLLARPVQVLQQHLAGVRRVQLLKLLLHQHQSLRPNRCRYRHC